MVKFLQKKVGGISLIDAGMIAVVKSLEERILTPFIGNGTLVSGAVKGVAGAVLSTMIGGRFGSIVGTAFIVDAGEDIVNFIIPTGSTRSLTTSLAPSNQTARRVL